MNEKLNQYIKMEEMLERKLEKALEPIISKIDEGNKANRILCDKIEAKVDKVSEQVIDLRVKNAAIAAIAGVLTSLGVHSLFGFGLSTKKI